MHNTTIKELIAFLRECLSIADLPQKLELDTSLWRTMDELWQRSVQHIARGQVSEWGGVLVLDEEDNLKLVSVVEGFACHRQTDKAKTQSLTRRLNVPLVHPSTGSTRQ